LVRVLAFDIGTEWAAALVEGAGKGRIFRRTLTGVSRGERLGGFYVDVHYLLTQHAPDIVVYERPHLRGWHATALLVGQMAVIEMAAWRFLNVVADGVSTSKVKLFATGNGRAEKDEVLFQMRARFGDRFHKDFGIVDDHAADAAALALLTEQERGNTCATTIPPRSTRSARPRSAARTKRATRAAGRPDCAAVS
jgi:Holliday junction resolvasome RuvABC endonuclease subunit